MTLCDNPPESLSLEEGPTLLSTPSVDSLVVSNDHRLVPNPSPSHRLAYMLLLSKVLQLQCCSMLLAAIWANPWAYLSSQSTHLGPPWTPWTTSQEKKHGLGFTVDQSINTNHASRTQEPQRPRWVSLRVGRGLCWEWFFCYSLDSNSIQNRCSQTNAKKRLLVFGIARFILAFPKSFQPWHTPSTSVYLVNAPRRLVNPHLFSRLRDRTAVALLWCTSLESSAFGVWAPTYEGLKNCFWHNPYHPEITGACETTL